MAENNKNRIEYINSQKAELIKERSKAGKSVLLVELNGKEIESWEEYVSEIESFFAFPTSCVDNMDRYLDWMRDLEWIEQKIIIILINNFEDFCKNNPSLKEEIVSDFEQIILPYWEEEVVSVCVGGVPRTFMVYLVKG